MILYVHLWNISIGAVCRTVMVGTSETHSKTVTANDLYICPKHVDKDVWRGGYTYGDTFSINQLKTKIVVTRTDRRKDSSTGWGMKLRFDCCRDVNVLKSN